MIQSGGVYATFCQEEAHFCKSIAIEMGGVSRYFSKVSGSGVDVTLLKLKILETPKRVPNCIEACIDKTCLNPYMRTFRKETCVTVAMKQLNHCTNTQNYIHNTCFCSLFPSCSPVFGSFFHSRSSPITISHCKSHSPRVYTFAPKLRVLKVTESPQNLPF